MAVRNKSCTWRPGWCSAAWKVPPECLALTQIDAGAIFGWLVLQQRDRGRGVTLKRPHGSPRTEARCCWRRMRELGQPATGLHKHPIPGWHDTHHFPSLFDQGEYAQDVGLLRSPAHPARGPGKLSSVPSPRPHLQPQTRPRIWAAMEEPCTERHTRVVRVPGRTWDSLTQIRV